MKNRAFTLAELLIVLGITGVVAAVLLPAANNLLPDKTKIAYLKVHDELINDIHGLASNSTLYPVCIENGESTIGCQEHPLLNTSKPLIKKFEDYEGDKKLCKLLAFTMGAEETCKDGDYTYSDSNFTSNLSFTTKNGMQWIVVPQARTIEEEKATFQSDIYVDVDPSKKSKNCMYDSVKCKTPDRFKFMIAADGTVIPADPMGHMYVNTRKSFMKNKTASTEGEVAAVLTESLREFSFKPCVEKFVPTCEEGYVLEGSTCVSATPQKPAPPMTPTCPEGTVLEGDSCVTPITPPTPVDVCSNRPANNTLANKATYWGGWASSHLEVYNTSWNGNQVSYHSFANLYSQDAIVRLDISEEKKDRSEWGRGRSTIVVQRLTHLGDGIVSALAATSDLDRGILNSAMHTVKQSYADKGPVVYWEDHGSINNNTINYMNRTKLTILEKIAKKQPGAVITRHTIVAGYDDDGNTEAVYMVRFRDFVDDILANYWSRKCG